MDRIRGSSVIGWIKRFIWSTPCEFELTFFALHQTVLSVTYKQYTVWYFHSKFLYSSKNRCMIVCAVCFKWNVSSQEVSMTYMIFPDLYVFISNAFLTDWKTKQNKVNNKNNTNKKRKDMEKWFYQLWIGNVLSHVDVYHQTDIQTDRLTDRHTDRHTDRQMYKRIFIKHFFYLSLI